MSLDIDRSGGPGALDADGPLDAPDAFDLRSPAFGAVDGADAYSGFGRLDHLSGEPIVAPDTPAAPLSADAIADAVLARIVASA